MSELRPGSPVRRPETARRRTPGAGPVGPEPPAGDGDAAGDHPPEVEPPSRDELERIQHHLVSLPSHDGATVSAADDLGVVLVRGPERGPDATYAAMPRWEAATWRASLERVSARLRDEGAWPSLLVCDRLDRPSGLASELPGDGWTRVTSETVLWVGHASVVPHLDPRLRIEAVQPRSVAMHEALERRIFGLPEKRAERRRDAMAAALETGHARAWIVWLEEEPVAVARLSQGRGVAGLQGIGVTAERRGQGFGTLITTIATRAGMAVGNRIIWLSVDPQDAVAGHVYAKLGFARLFGWTRWLRTESPRPRG